MGKYEKKKPVQSRRKWILPVITAFGLLAVLTIRALSGQEQMLPGIQTMDSVETIPVTEPAKDTVLTETPSETIPDDWFEETVDFPIPLEDGKLVVESLFPFEGINPDCNNLEGIEVAAIMIRNVSDQYLNSANLLIHLKDGSQIAFSISDLPAGGEMLAFSVDNLELSDNFECFSVESAAEFIEIRNTEGIGISVDGMTVTVTNETGAEINQIDIFCHGVFATSYYGGSTYIYTIEKLNPGESASVTVTECVLGMVDVVRVSSSEER